MLKYYWLLLSIFFFFLSENYPSLGLFEVNVLTEVCIFYSFCVPFALS